MFPFRPGMGIPISNPEPAPLPFAWGVLYRHPNPDGSRKACKNCMMWVSGEDACMIHDRGVDVPASFVCGFHVYGAPVEKWMDHPGGREPVQPELSGLREAGSGVSCANCRYYQPRNGEAGLCLAVAKEDRRPPQPVEALGWCARYESMSIGG